MICKAAFPDRISPRPQSRNLDVAALYFFRLWPGAVTVVTCLRTQSPNPWLAGNSLKMLVGYPVDGAMFGDASVIPGEMYKTAPQPYALVLATDPVGDQMVYTAPWFLGYPGNSGGPSMRSTTGFIIRRGFIWEHCLPGRSLPRRSCGP